MDVYSTTFTLPRASSSISGGADATPPNFGEAQRHMAGGSSRSLLLPHPAAGSASSLPLPVSRPPPPAPITSRMGSMRSRFPPSVKAFMPSAFGGSKRASERIVEATGPGDEGEAVPATEAEKDGKAEASTGTDGEATADGAASDAAPETPTKEDGPVSKVVEPIVQPISASPPPITPPNLAAARMSSQHRDSRSTVDTRSSVDFSSAASASADSTIASTVATGAKISGGGIGGGSSTRATSEAAHSVTHSANASLSGAHGVGPQQTGAELADAMTKLAQEAMGAHQCIVACDPVPQSEAVQQQQQQQHASSAQQAFSRQNSLPSPFASSPSSFQNNYPYQQYAQGFDHDAISNAFPSRMGGMSHNGGGMLGIASPYGMAVGSTTSLHSTHSLGAVPHASHASVAPPSAQPSAPKFTFHISGGYAQVMGARGAILREAPFKARSVIKVPRADILDSAPTRSTPTAHGINTAPTSPSSDLIKPYVRARLDEISAETKAHVALVGNEPHGRDLGYGLETERSVELAIAGSFEGVEQARVRILVLLDELTGLHTEACEIDYKLHNIIGGRKRHVIQTIQEETATSIYLPTPFSGIISSGRAEANLLTRQSTVYISGEFFGVQRARDMLFQVSAHKSKCIISRDTAILPRKVDWMLSERLDELRNIMMDNGTFINLPALGSQVSVVSVYGDNRVSIERTIRSVMQLACQFYVASLWLLPVAYDAFMPSATFNGGQLAPVLKQISTASGAEVVFKSNCFELHGLENEVRTAVSLILDLEVVRAYNFEVRFQIELANEHREFISGKKNGKINKIMKQCGVRIKFETFNDYNFLIDVSGNDRAGALQGLAFLQEELPAEVSFHVPEAYHKRIIGVGGKSIQRIMKKYGVYVKFSNAEEFAALGGYVDNEDNVVARTPAKNAINLENLKQAVMELVNPKDKDYVTETVTISRRYHRTLLGEKGIFIHDIESKTSSVVRFPPKETASDLVSIFGPESQIHIAAQMLLDHVPFEAEFRTPNSAELAQVVASHDFVALTERVKRDLNISIVPIVGVAAANADGSTGRELAGTEAIFKLRLNRSNADFLPASKDALEDFLVSRNIHVYSSPSRARSDSFASSFPHFATKLISTAAESTDSFQTDAVRYHNERSRLRAAASTPDIKALFDSPGQYANHYTTSPYGQPTASTNPTNSPLVTSVLYPSPYPEPRSSLSSNDVWAAPTLPQPTPPGSSGGIAFPHHGARMSDDVALIHKNVDALGVEERVRALRKPRSFAHRGAQSLDMGALNAQQQAAQGVAAGTVPRPYGAIGSTPANVMHPHGAPGSSYVSGHGTTSSISRLAPSSGGGANPDPSTMDEVSRVLAQLAFDRT